MSHHPALTSQRGWKQLQSKRAKLHAARSKFLERTGRAHDEWRERRDAWEAAHRQALLDGVEAELTYPGDYVPPRGDPLVFNDALKELESEERQWLAANRETIARGLAVAEEGLLKRARLLVAELEGITAELADARRTDDLLRAAAGLPANGAPRVTVESVIDASRRPRISVSVGAAAPSALPSNLDGVDIS